MLKSYSIQTCAKLRRSYQSLFLFVYADGIYDRSRRLSNSKLDSRRKLFFLFLVFKRTGGTFLFCLTTFISKRINWSTGRMSFIHYLKSLFNSGFLAPPLQSSGSSSNEGSLTPRGSVETLVASMEDVLEAVNSTPDGAAVTLTAKTATSLGTDESETSYHFQICASLCSIINDLSFVFFFFCFCFCWFESFFCVLI